MSDPYEPTSSGGGRLGGIVWALVAFLAAALLFLDPLSLHPLDEWLRAATGGSSETSEAHSASSEELWTCGMHPQVVESAPGSCPICGMDLVPMGAGDVEPAGHDHGDHGEVWTCPMHPEVLQHEPGSCPICGMDLVEAPRPDGGDAAEVRLEPAVLRALNVQTEVVEQRDVHRRVRTVGYLEFDQQRMVTVTTKYAGWIETVQVNYVGEAVRKGQPLFEIYSPELVQTEQELLSARSFAGRLQDASEETRQRAEALVEAARTRLSYWDVSADQIAELERTGEVFRTLTVRAPASGVVMKRRDGLEGMAVEPGMELFHIADLRSLWLSVEAFEDQIAWLQPGTPAEVTFGYFPGERFRGTVRLLDPQLSEETRTLGVRLTVPNPDLRLRPGMFATVTFEPRAAAAVPAVPTTAVLRSGVRDAVVVALGEGRFAPREVSLGREGDGYVEVLTGVEPGERVVTSAQFLIDSESSLRAAIRRLAGAGEAPPEHQH